MLYNCLSLYFCRKPRSHEGQARNGNKAKGKKEKTEPEQGDGCNSNEMDQCEQDMQIVDFDKLMGTLKYEKKLVEISIPSAPATSESKVCTACNGTATLTLMQLRPADKKC